MNGWQVSWSGSDPTDEGRREALCTLGNGLFATRGVAPEHAADQVHYPGTYAAGVFNRLSDQVDGETIVNESLVNLPNWLVLAWAPMTRTGTRPVRERSWSTMSTSTCATAR